MHCKKVLAIIRHLERFSGRINLLTARYCIQRRLWLMSRSLSSWLKTKLSVTTCISMFTKASRVKIQMKTLAL